MARTAVVDREEAGEAAGSGPPTPRRRGRTALAVAVGLVVGIGAAVFIPRLLDGDDATPNGDLPSAAVDDDGAGLAEERTDAARAALPSGPVPEGADAPSAEAAVTGFLDAEVAGDFASSFGYLSDADRLDYATPAGWVGGHADVMPPVLGYELVEVGQPGDEGTPVVTQVRLEPGLNQVTGLTPSAARATWMASEGDDGAFGVALDASTLAPAYPPAEGADDAARSWLDARLACEAPAEERPALVGSPAIAEPLCGADRPDVAASEALSAIDAQPVLNAYGQAAASGSRLVRLSGPVDLGVVLAPLGEAWTVIAVVP